LSHSHTTLILAEKICELRPAVLKQQNRNFPGQDRKSKMALVAPDFRVPGHVRKS
jgi:hypothetical protein